MAKISVSKTEDRGSSPRTGAIFARVAQWIRRWITNPENAGSSPAARSSNSGCSSAWSEYRTWNPGAAGSNPATQTTTADEVLWLHARLCPGKLGFDSPRRYGPVAQWKAHPIPSREVARSSRAGIASAPSSMDPEHPISTRGVAGSSPAERIRLTGAGHRPTLGLRYGRGRVRHRDEVPEPRAAAMERRQQPPSRQSENSSPRDHDFAGFTDERIRLGTTHCSPERGPIELRGVGALQGKLRSWGMLSL